MTHQMYHLANVPALTCLITEPIPDPRKKAHKNADAGNVTASSGQASGGFSSLEGHYARHPSGSSPMSLLWFSKIKLSADVQKHLAYPESCLIISEEGEGIGKMFTSVELSSWAGRSCLLVHSGSYARIGPEVDVGTSLTGFITPDLKVIQELCHEWSLFHGVKFDRKTFLSEEGIGSLHCRTTYKRGDVLKFDHVTSIPFIDLKTFVSESASILLQRLIIFEKKSGSITLKALDSQGTTVPVDYHVLGRGIENVKGEKVEVHGIRRSLWRDSIKHEGIAWDSVFNFYGRLVLRCQPHGNDHALIPLWFRPVEERDEFGQFSGMRPPIIWACDQQLYSNYLMKKTELSAQYKTYLMDHPALRSLLSDFMQKVLFSKPKDVFQFANEYFSRLLKLRQDSPESSDCETSSSCSDEDEEDAELEEEEAKQTEDAEIMENILQLHRKMYPLMKGENLTPFGFENDGECDPPLFPPPPSSPPERYAANSNEDENFEEHIMTQLVPEAEDGE